MKLTVGYKFKNGRCVDTQHVTVKGSVGKKEESKSHHSSFFWSNDIMSCQSETKSINITNGVNCQQPGTVLQLPAAYNDRFIPEKTLRDNVSVFLCVSRGMAYHLQHILLIYFKNSGNTFQF